MKYNTQYPTHDHILQAFLKVVKDTTDAIETEVDRIHKDEKNRPERENTKAVHTEHLIRRFYQAGHEAVGLELNKMRNSSNNNT